MIGKPLINLALVGSVLLFGNCNFRETIDVEYQVYSVVLGKYAQDFIVLEKTSNDWVPADNSSSLSIGSEYKGLQEDLISKNRVQHIIKRRFPSEGNYVAVKDEELNKTLSERPDYRFFWFSRVGFSNDGKHALVYVGMNCGSLCGEGVYYLLARKEHTWEIVKKSQVWVS